MSGKKFTKGPWDYIKQHSSSGFYIQTEDLSHKKTFIGEVGGGLQSIHEIRSNAKLIAAAPDLLDALEELLPIAETMINSNHPTWKKVKAAIKKAIE